MYISTRRSWEGRWIDALAQREWWSEVLNPGTAINHPLCAGSRAHASRSVPAKMCSDWGAWIGGCVSRTILMFFTVTWAQITPWMILAEESRRSPGSWISGGKLRQYRSIAGAFKELPAVQTVPAREMELEATGGWSQAHPRDRLKNKMTFHRIGKKRYF